MSRSTTQKWQHRFEPQPTRYPRVEWFYEHAPEPHHNDKGSCAFCLAPIVERKR